MFGKTARHGGGIEARGGFTFNSENESPSTPLLAPLLLCCWLQALPCGQAGAGACCMPGALAELAAGWAEMPSAKQHCLLPAEVSEFPPTGWCTLPAPCAGKGPGWGGTATCHPAGTSWCQAASKALCFLPFPEGTETPE